MNMCLHHKLVASAIHGRAKLGISLHHCNDKKVKGIVEIKRKMFGLFKLTSNLPPPTTCHCWTHPHEQAGLEHRLRYCYYKKEKKKLK
jgi:hypothetical protein